LGHRCHRDGSEQEHRRHGHGDRLHDNSSHVYAKKRHEPDEDITTILFENETRFADLANRSEVREASWSSLGSRPRSASAEGNGK
jgi:hypothetical protein